MKNFLVQCCIATSIALLMAIALHPMTKTIEEQQVDARLADYRLATQAVKDLCNRERGLFNDLKAQRKALQQKIQQARSVFAINLTLIENRVQKSRQDLSSALDRIYAKAITGAEQADALEKRKNTLDPADAEAQKATKELESLANEQPGIIVD